MITDTDKYQIIKLAKKYNIAKLFLFGSSLSPHLSANDIDLAVEGLADKYFFQFYGDLILHLSRPVDLVDIEKKSRFRDIVLKEGILLYGNDER